jgi:type IV secretory pathway VirB10-like protein
MALVSPTENWMPRIAPRLHCAGVLIAFYSLASIACAQWAWRDPNGRPVYSDLPPPPSIKASDILMQPTPAPAPVSQSPDSPDAAPQTPPGATAPAAAPPAPRAPSVAEREQEFRKRMKQREDAEKKQNDAQAMAARDAEDCLRARGYLKSIDDGLRLVRTNPDGSREALDDAERAAEAQRARDIIENRCK